MSRRQQTIHKWKRILRRADKHRIKRALCRLEPDYRRGWAAPKYDEWHWD